MRSEWKYEEENAPFGVGYVCIEDVIYKDGKDALGKDMIKKLTPVGTLDWYIKWIASVIILIGMCLTSINFMPYNLFFHFVGVMGWLVVGVMWHDRALMVVNSVAVMIFFMGILNYYFGGAYP